MYAVKFDVDEFVAEFRTTQRRMHMAGLQAWRDVLGEARRAMIRYRYKDRTGALTASMHSHASSSGPFGYFGHVEATAPYAGFVDDGTRQHVIAARPGGWLRWIGADGRPVFRRAVLHPGTQARRFSREAVDTFNNRVSLRVESAMGEAAG
jgi:hypothetical protein